MGAFESTANGDGAAMHIEGRCSVVPIATACPYMLPCPVICCKVLSALLGRTWVEPYRERKRDGLFYGSAAAFAAFATDPGPRVAP